MVTDKVLSQYSNVIAFLLLHRLRLGTNKNFFSDLDFFLKWYNLVRFSVYLDKILSLKTFKNYYFS